ncbi:hypothetical protein [Ramlibacter sp. PS4R-6]|uniref:hypothetical protein n=1 Tax=Ramlibacter sp. PS4R-6 TaxID=3133438 RepID=UPI00309FF6D3
MHTPSLFRHALLVGAALAALVSFAAEAATKTVCTITVNSADEREMFKRHLPPGDYKFVELVERNRPDWLASACQAKVQCDALIISGHFDGGDEFYTDSNEKSEYLTVAEMERASCSDSCPGVFANLKEVYLFGCNTLKPLPEQHALSNRDRIRHIFKDVPVIYGFSSKAPLGRYAGPVVERWLQTQPEVGSGKVNQKLLGAFAQVSMTVTPGITNADPQAKLRADACRFIDDRLSPAQKVEFLHEVLKGDLQEVRMLQEQLERFANAIGPKQRFESKTAAAFASLARDQATRERYLDFARTASESPARMRMMAFARNIGWLTPSQEQAEFLRMLGERVARDDVGREEIDMACTRERDAGSESALKPLATGVFKSSKVAPFAALACLGNAEAHARVVRAMASADTQDVAMVQTYLRHRPLTDSSEMRTVASSIGKMPTPGAQVRALETLARQRVSDPESLREIARLFPSAKSVDVQRAIAAILIRADHRVLGQADLARSLKQHRLKSPDGGSDVIDALIRVLQAG